MITTALILWLLAYANWRRFRDPLYPGFMQSVVWATVVTLFFATPEFGPIHPITWVVITCGVVSFTFGSFAATVGHDPVLCRTWISSEAGKIRTWSALLVPAAALPFFVRTARAISEQGLSDSFFVSLRDQVGSQEAGFGHFDLVMRLSFAAAGVAMLNLFGVRKRHKCAGIIASATVCVATVYAVLFTGRNFVLFACLIVLGVPLALRVFSPVKAGLSMVAFVFALFTIYAFVLNHGNIADADPHNSLAVLKDLTALYTVGPIAAFDTLVRHPAHMDWGLNSFRNVILWLNGLGCDFNLKPLVQEFTEVSSSGLFTNIYTVHQPMYLDFGVLGVICFQLLAGAWHSFLYRRATVERPNGAYVLLYAVFLLPLFMQIEVDYYLTILAQWVFFIAVTAALFWFASPRVPEPNNS